MKLAISGHNSRIAQAFKRLVWPAEYSIAQGYRTASLMPRDWDGYLLCHGVLYGKALQEMALDDWVDTLNANFISTARFCDEVFEKNDRARVCIIGSEAGFSGSYDMIYAASKAAVHLYVTTKRLRTDRQQLVAVAPWIIQDAGMTVRRTDFGTTMARGAERRLKRWLYADEIARIAQMAIREDALCNTVIRATGGNW